MYCIANMLGHANNYWSDTDYTSMLGVAMLAASTMMLTNGLYRSFCMTPPSNALPSEEGGVCLNELINPSGDRSMTSCSENLDEVLSQLMVPAADLAMAANPNFVPELLLTYILIGGGCMVEFISNNSLEVALIPDFHLVIEAAASGEYHGPVLNHRSMWYPSSGGVSLTDTPQLPGLRLSPGFKELLWNGWFFSPAVCPIETGARMLCLDYGLPWEGVFYMGTSEFSSA